jgi:uncharacterized SAM-binding protein YcdF (DUF218 family)
MEISGFWIKRILGQGLMPLGVSVCLSLWGMLLALVGRPKRAVAPFVLAALVLYAVGLDPVAAWMVAPLERAYAPLRLDDSRLAGVRWIVVLGSGHHQDAALPPLLRLDTVATARLAEALRLARRAPRARVLCTGGSPTGGTPHAEVLAAAAVTLGVDAGRVAVENASLDTPQQITEVARRVGREPWVLVTSAIHMPRAVRLARAHGLFPIPAPAAFETFSPESLPFLPYARNILACHRALHEYLGLLWGWITGRLQLWE